ncbi:hypothetical protein K501DRAFT_252729 [Backusella circina FSU 941]|nr:hypothetical protein K501DRAFT_252729 [Backusella circina FSU 941]
MKRNSEALSSPSPAKRRDRKKTPPEKTVPTTKTTEKPCRKSASTNLKHIITVRNRHRATNVKEESQLKLRFTVNQEKQPSISRDYDETYNKTFGHKLTVAESSTKRGTVTEVEKTWFAEATRIAEEKCIPKGQVPKVKTLSFGDYLIQTWYDAPHPEEYNQTTTLHMCEFCMKYLKNEYVESRHKVKCNRRSPPGNEIYRDGNISIFEVDGRKNKVYCQNLCLLAKMFLNHKTLYYDVEPFLFYIMTEVDNEGCHLVGYFSKEKCSAMDYNLSCILTLPMYQRKGYGQFLIGFSYLLSREENRLGTPERPLSELGLLSYKSYWKRVLYDILADQAGSVSVQDIITQTGMPRDDIISTLQSNEMFDLDLETDKCTLISDDNELIKSYVEEQEKKASLRIDQKRLTWTPFVLSRSRLIFK